MIIGPDFIWLHFPKCAGTRTEQVIRKHFGTDPTLRFDEINPEHVVWHQSVREREEATGENLGGRRVVCNIRRLPHWILSRVGYEEMRSDIYTPREMFVRGSFINRWKKVENADAFLSDFTVVPVDAWIRVDFIASDFAAAFSPVLDLTGINLRREFAKRSNETKFFADSTPWLTSEELAILYDSCPVWTALEKRLYGELLTGDVAPENHNRVISRIKSIIGV